MPKGKEQPLFLSGVHKSGVLFGPPYKSGLLFGLTFIAVNAGSQVNNKRHVIRLDFCLVRRLVSYHRAAPLAPVDYHISTLRVTFRAYRAHYPAAGVLPVTGVYVNMQRAEAERTVVPRRVPEGEHLTPAVFAYKSGIVFSKSLCLHKTSACRIELSPPGQNRKKREDILCVEHYFWGLSA